MGNVAFVFNTEPNEIMDYLDIEKIINGTNFSTSGALLLEHAKYGIAVEYERLENEDDEYQIVAKTLHNVIKKQPVDKQKRSYNIIKKVFLDENSTIKNWHIDEETGYEYMFVGEKAYDGYCYLVEEIK